MIKLAIVVGHTERQPGASGVSPIDSSEYAWNSDLAAMIVDHVAQVDDAEAKVFFRDSGGIVAAYNDAKAWGADAAMELHFNAAGPSATGSETLYVTSVSRPLAEAVQDATVSVLGLRDRGVKTPQEASGGRGARNLSQMGAKPSILTEP
ncbi:MAG: N-acetylmuramoyl-L-alanine amidase, partial [Rhodospirillaceae bacterium]|nr:N-acetylmuramoyl-L-alanine amidase [Rhodospirillaceae bacterium]